VKPLSKPLAGLLLAVVICLGVGITMVVEKNVAPGIQASRDTLRNQVLLGVIPAQSYDNQPLQQPLELPGRTPDSAVVEGFLATLESRPVAIFFHSRGQGYAGPIELLIGVSVDGRLNGIKVLSHAETAGLGARIVSEPQWLNGFLGKSLTDPDDAGWKLKQDGGTFDQIAGATITSRGAIDAIRETLRYFDAEKTRLLPNLKGERP
jgi:electron transport complex protein RnfG